jgi:hypothetical protein
MRPMSLISRSITTPLLEPNSIVTRFSPALRTICSPTALLPVKLTLLIRPSPTSGSPTSEPEPGRALIPPSGNPASTKARASAIPESGAAEAGFRITGQPAATAGPSLWAARFSGKLKGVMAATVPMGNRS